MHASTLDYGAAHSMDTEWFCVDADGRVAVFDSGEDGAVPIAAALGLNPGDASFDVELLERARLAKHIDDDGLYHFHRDHGEDPGLYTRSECPAQALMLDELDPSIRANVGALVLPVDFSRVDSLHLADHLRDDEAYTWSDEGLRLPAHDPSTQVATPTSTHASGGKLVLIVVLLLIALAWVLST